MAYEKHTWELLEAITKDLLDHLETQYDEAEAAFGVPSGTIVMWHGTIANIPAGYVICDGDNSTPDLLAKFVQGVATALTDPGATGGAVTHAHTIPNTPGVEPGPTNYYLTAVNTAVADGRPPFYDIAFIMKT